MRAAVVVLLVIVVGINGVAAFDGFEAFIPDGASGIICGVNFVLLAGIIIDWGRQN